MSKPSFATFWHGNAPSPYERACLASFALGGYDLAVYAFTEVPQLPAGIVRKDARSIVDEKTLTSFAVSGKPSIAHFTDYFRLAMFRHSEEIWVDTDIVLLRPFDVKRVGNLMGQETRSSVCNAVLRLDPADPRLDAMIARVELLAKSTLHWGDTGPRLLTAIYGVHAGLPQETFYPVHFDDYYKVFLPEFREECDFLCSQAITLHLWNNLVVKMGLFKSIGPPSGSYLHAQFERLGMLTEFDLLYPEAVMKMMVHNAVVKIGEDAGLKKVVRLVKPSIKSSLARRWPNLF